jgi:hypothetical protein
MGYCEVSFIGPEFDGAEEELGGLTDKLQQTANNEALDKFGDGYLRNPTDLEVMPLNTLDGPRFLVRAVHSTQSPPGQSAIIQRSAHDFSFRLTRESDGPYIRTETERAYPLDRREYGVLKRLAKIAVKQSIDMIDVI